MSWSKELQPSSLKDAHPIITKAFEEQGPFDGLLCFSQGVTIMMGYLLEQITRYPTKPLPVKFAVFCSAGPLLSPDPSWSETIYGSLSPEDLQRLRSGDPAQADLLPEPARSSVRPMISVANFFESTIKLSAKDYVSRPLTDIPYILLPGLYKARLPIPTLHAYAKNDPAIMRWCAKLTESFCDPKGRQSFEHTAIHNLPRSAEEAQNMVAAIESLISRCSRPQMANL